MAVDDIIIQEHSRHNEQHHILRSSRYRIEIWSCFSAKVKFKNVSPRQKWLIKHVISTIISINMMWRKDNYKEFTKNAK